ncbi:hypothetical protein QAD02_019737 [Eretmocerus hayati]|uniref:Uncharacterized protein n=1 Tax=Eretmocerus hayati TaxID=131215 RepID=A0ACC2PKK6_9HYME|nr:hypothetical protein QAD02_019737 [Eretmocerus hayati]
MRRPGETCCGRLRVLSRKLQALWGPSTAGSHISLEQWLQILNRMPPLLSRPRHPLDNDGCDDDEARGVVRARRPPAPQFERGMPTRPTTDDDYTTFAPVL